MTNGTLGIKSIQEQSFLEYREFLLNWETFSWMLAVPLTTQDRFLHTKKKKVIRNGQTIITF